MGNLDYDYNEYYQTMFPHFGMCMQNTNSNFAFIPIPRCGSSYLLKYLHDDCGWKPNNYHFILEKQFFSVVRDPYRRWLSGLWAIADPDPTSDIIVRPVDLYDRQAVEKMFDDPGLQNHHTMLQYLFFRDLDISKITFFNFDDPNFFTNIKHFFTNSLGLDVSTMTEWHSSDEKVEIKKIIESYSEDNLNKLQNWLKQDYKFLEQIKFYEAN